MTSAVFDPADPACWISRGRTPVHAEAIAAAWRDFPDLALTAPLAARMERTRARAAAMKPVHEAIRIETELVRVAANFAFAEAQVERDGGDPLYSAVLRARDRHDMGWNDAIRFADGYLAARAGWDARPPSGADRDGASRAAYNLGFREGGGCPDDIFDTARRALALPLSTVAHSPRQRRARPAPRDWPSPSDHPRPVRWGKRLLIVGPDSSVVTALLAELWLHAGHREACIIRAEAGRGFARYPGDADGVSGSLASLIGSREFEDVLIVADDPDLAWIERHAAAIPLCRTMERTRNSLLQQRAQFRLWLARGLDDGEVRAAGHIRWGKVTKGL